MRRKHMWRRGDSLFVFTCTREDCATDTGFLKTYWRSHFCCNLKHLSFKKGWNVSVCFVQVALSVQENWNGLHHFFKYGTVHSLQWTESDCPPVTVISDWTVIMLYVLTPDLLNYCRFNIRLCACTWCAGLRLTLSLFHLMSRSLLEFSVLSVGGTVSLLPSLSYSCQFITTQFLDFLTVFPAPLALSSLLQFSLPVLCVSLSRPLYAEPDYTVEAAGQRPFFFTTPMLLWRTVGCMSVT